jgi:putative oxidoreductase
MTGRGLQFSLSIIRVGYLWPLMKCINLMAGTLLIINRAPAFALALLAPITVVIVWFQIFFNPLPVPLAMVAVAVACELVLVRAYASRYASLFQRVDLNG